MPKPTKEQVTAEVMAAADQLGWGHQVRRKWSVRERPVWESGIEDYEWKLIPEGALPAWVEDTEFQEGVYYVLSYDPDRDVFVLQHDTIRAGAMGLAWGHTTSTTFAAATPSESRIVPHQVGLRDHLLDLTRRFGPNRFSLT